jgi:hypothetical protein
LHLATGQLLPGLLCRLDSNDRNTHSILQEKTAAASQATVPSQPAGESVRPRKKCAAGSRSGKFFP